MAVVMDEFEEYRSRATNVYKIPYFKSRDDSYHDNITKQNKMRMRASFKSDSAYRSRKRHAQDPEQCLANRLTQMNLRAHDKMLNDVSRDQAASNEIDCDFPPPVYADPNVQNAIATKPDILPIQVVAHPIPHAHRSLPMTPSPPTHHRSRSCRIRSHLRQNQQFQPLEPRQRTYSMPSRSKYRRPHFSQLSTGDDTPGTTVDASQDLYRVRTFSISAKGIVNRGDSFKKKCLSAQSSLEGNKHEPFRPRLPSATSQESKSSLASSDSAPAISATHTVVVMGSNGVGKTSLLRQFMTSEDLGNTDIVQDDGCLKSVSVLLDDAESDLQFINMSDAEEVTSDSTADAFLIVFALNDRESFDEAVMCLHVLRKRALLDKKATILVANKGDIVRGRDVDEEEAKIMAVRYGCKYVEVSAILNLKVDELLVGILKQIRLNDKRKPNNRKPKSSKTTSCVLPDNGCIPPPMEIMGKIFGRQPRVFRSCDNLLVL